MFRSTKRFAGLSCLYRQWREKGEASILAGAVLTFTVVLEAQSLDDSNTVVDGALEKFDMLRHELERWYKRTTLVARDDPEIRFFELMYEHRGINMNKLDYVGNAAFAKHAHSLVVDFLRMSSLSYRIKCVSTTCADHRGESATYYPPATQGE